MGFLSHPPEHVLRRKIETSGGVCAAAVQLFASRLATRRERIPSPSSSLVI